MDQRTRIVAAVIKGLKLPPRFRLRLMKEDPVRLELSLTPAYGKDPITVGLVAVSYTHLRAHETG